MWPWTLTCQKFILCVSSQGQDLYSHQKLSMYIYWFSSESGYRRRRRQYNHYRQLCCTLAAVTPILYTGYTLHVDSVKDCVCIGSVVCRQCRCCSYLPGRTTRSAWRLPTPSIVWIWAATTPRRTRTRALPTLRAHTASSSLTRAAVNTSTAWHSAGLRFNWSTFSSCFFSQDVEIYQKLCSSDQMVL